MDEPTFQQLVDDGITSLRPDIQAKLDAVLITVADQPTPEQCQVLGLRTGAEIFGLYEGVPLTERGVLDDVLLPDTITIFREPILAVYTDPDDIATCVANTVWHEVAHYFGMDEAMVEAEEVRRGKTV